MTQIQEEFLNELRSTKKLRAAQYAVIYKKYNELAIENEVSKGVGKHQANSMGNYYTLCILSNFIDNENTVTRIIDLAEKI